MATPGGGVVRRPADGLTAWRPWSLPSLRGAFNAVKLIDPRFASWWAENSKESYNTGLANAAAAFDNYAKSKRGGQRDRAAGVPRFRSRRKARLACRFTTGTIRVDTDGRHVTLPRLGTIRTHEPTGELLARLGAGTARVLSATVRFERGRWFVAFQTEVRRDLEKVARPGATVGVDLGVKTLAVTADSTGQVREVPNPRHLDAALRSAPPGWLRRRRWRPRDPRPGKPHARARVPPRPKAPCAAAAPASPPRERRRVVADEVRDAGAVC